MMRTLAIGLLVIGMYGCGQFNPLVPDDERAPVIDYFAADSPRVFFPNSTTLHWEVKDKSASIRIDPYPGNVAPIGSVVVTPTNTLPMNFTLSATNKFGTSQRYLTIQVQ